MREFMGISVKLTKLFILIGNINRSNGSIYNISQSQIKILSFIGQRLSEGKAVFQKDIESEFGLKGSSVSSILNTLEKNQWIRRESVDFDARLKSIVFSDMAEVVMKHLQELYDIFDYYIKENLSDAELIVFTQCIDKITNSITNNRDTLSREFEKLESTIRREIKSVNKYDKD